MRRERLLPLIVATALFIENMDSTAITTSRWEPGMRDEDTRFFGLKRECGMHEQL